MATLFQRGDIWHVRYWHRGCQVRNSLHTTSKMEARAELERIEAEIEDGKEPGFLFDKLTFGHMAESLLRDYRNKERKSFDRMEFSIKHLRSFFGEMKARQITAKAIGKYIDNRKSGGARNGTINRELSAIRRMFTLIARENPSFSHRIPSIDKLPEAPPRKGFFEHHEFQAVHEHLPGYIKGLATFAYRTGWRTGEILNLKWDQVDTNEGTVTLAAGTTKNDEPRIIILDTECMRVMREQHLNRYGSEYVFNHNGKPIREFRHAWKSACNKAGIGPKLFHDFRRTAVRNLIRAGTPEVVAMRITGHKTRAVFDRYNIVNTGDLKRAAEKMDAYLQEQANE